MAASDLVAVGQTTLKRLVHLHTVVVICDNHNICSLPLLLLPLLAPGILPQTLRSLTLAALPNISIKLLKAISTGCPGLSTLELGVAERLESEMCCWNCYEESTSCILHSPVGQQFSDLASLLVSGRSATRSLICAYS